MCMLFVGSDEVVVSVSVVASSFFHNCGSWKSF